LRRSRISGDRQAALARRQLRRLWAEAARRAPRCGKPRPVQPAFETLESRFMLTTVQFSASSYFVNENAGSVTISVTLDALPSQNVTVNYATSEGSAFAGRQYTPASGTLTFTPTDLTKTFTVTILDDAVSQANDTVKMALSNPTNATLGSPSSATLTISDNDFTIPTAGAVPLYITKGPDSNLWFAEYGANQIGKVTTSGVFTEFSVPTASSHPFGIVTGSDSNLWFGVYGSKNRPDHDLRFLHGVLLARQ
jgi:hypothetical protein